MTAYPRAEQGFGHACSADMEIFFAHQTAVFLRAVVFGALASLLYDFLRAWRIGMHLRQGMTFILDLLFCAVCAAALFLFIVVVSDGFIRGYIFLGLLLGAILYFYSFSQLFLRLFGMMIRGICLPFACIKKPVLAVFRRIKLIKTLKKQKKAENE